MKNGIGQRFIGLKLWGFSLLSLTACNMHDHQYWKEYENYPSRDSLTLIYLPYWWEKVNYNDSIVVWKTRYDLEPPRCIQKRILRKGNMIYWEQDTYENGQTTIDKNGRRHLVQLHVRYTFLPRNKNEILGYSYYLSTDGKIKSIDTVSGDSILRSWSPYFVNMYKR